VLATAHDLVREHRIISAIGTTPVPVPPALGLCVDERVNGAPFCVMDYVDGVVLDSRQAASDLSRGVCRTLAEDLIDVLAELHAVDVDGGRSRSGTAARPLLHGNLHLREVPADQVEPAGQLPKRRPPGLSGTGAKPRDPPLCLDRRRPAGRASALLPGTMTLLRGQKSPGEGHLLSASKP